MVNTFLNWSPWRLVLNKSDLKKILKIFNCFVDFKMLWEIEIFKVSKYITINEWHENICWEIYTRQKKIYTEGKDNDLRVLRNVLMKAIFILCASTANFKLTWVSVVLCTCKCVIHKLYSPAQVVEFWTFHSFYMNFLIPFSIPHWLSCKVTGNCCTVSAPLSCRGTTFSPNFWKGESEKNECLKFLPWKGAYYVPGQKKKTCKNKIWL